MKQFKKFISVLLAISLCLSLFCGLPFANASESEPVVFVKSTGDDTAAGTEAAPLKTIEKAYAVLDGKMDSAGKKTDTSAMGNIVLLDKIVIAASGHMYCYASDKSYVYTVKVSGKTQDAGITFNVSTQAYYNACGPVIYDNMTFTNVNNGNNFVSLHCAKNSYMEIGKNVKTVANANKYNIIISGAPSKGSVTNGDSTLIVKSGTYRNVFAGAYVGTYTGKSKLIMQNAKALNVYAAYKRFSGTADITLENVTLSTAVYMGAYDKSATLNTGNSTLTLKGTNSISNGIRITDSETYKLSGDAIINIENTNFNCPVDIKDGDVLGGLTYNFKNSTLSTALADNGGNADVNMDKLSAKSGENTSISGKMTYTADEFTGGGNLILGKNTVLFAKSVTGETTFKFSEDAADGVHIIAPKDTPDSAFTYGGTGESSIKTEGDYKKWYVGNDTVNSALILYAPKAVTVNLYGGMPTLSRTTPVANTATLVNPSETAEIEGIKYYYYNNLPSRTDGYHYKVNGTGYYTVIKVVNYPESKAVSMNYLDVNPGLKAGNGYEPTGTVYGNTDELIEKVTPVKESWKTDYPTVYNTPTIKAGDQKAKNEFTSDQEMQDFVSALDDANDNLYRFSLGKSPTNNFDMPLAIFTKTDISGCADYKAAAQEMAKSGVPTVMYQAQIHGNEPAGGDGALAVMQSLDGEYGENILNKVNIIVIPRANPDGSKKFTTNNLANNFDMNRDHIKLESAEVTAIHEVYNTFLPSVFIDGHEYNGVVVSKNDQFRDVLLAVGGGYNTTDKLTQTGVKAVSNVIGGLNAEGIRTTYYPATSTAGAVSSEVMINTANFSSGRGYYSLKGCITLLVETRGIGLGKQNFERRVVGQYIAVTSLLDYVAENMSEINDSVNYERNYIENEGKTFDINNTFGLYTGSYKDDHIDVWSPTYNHITGELYSAPDKTIPCYYYDKAEKSRPRTTAFVLPKDAAGAADALEIIKKHEIYYYEVPANTKIRLRQYGGEVTPVSGTSYYEVENATLTDDSDFTFSGGAYVFPTNQVGGTLLMYLFEPDVKDTYYYGSGLCHNRTLAPESIYRYEHDLESDGTVYTGEWYAAPEGLTVIQPTKSVPTGKITGLNTEKTYEYRELKEDCFKKITGVTEIDNLAVGDYEIKYEGNHSATFAFSILEPAQFDARIFLDTANGSDSNSGNEETAAVKTITKAYELLNSALSKIGEKTGEIVLLSNYALTSSEFTVGSNNTITFPASNYEVILCGKTADVQIYGTYTIEFSSDTVIKNITLRNSTTSTSTIYRYICGAGHKLTVDTGVSVTANKVENHFSLVGGKYTGSITNVDLTVKSGEWRNVYFGNYAGGTVSGNININILGGSVANTFTTSYSATTNADVFINIQNCTVSGESYLGNTKSGNATGKITLKIGEGAVFNDIYCGSRDAGNSGNVTVILAGGKAGTINGKAKNTTGTVKYATFIKLSGSYTAYQNFNEQYFDYTGDNAITSADADYVAETIVGIKPTDSTADANGDGKTDVTDCVLYMFLANKL